MDNRHGAIVVSGLTERGMNFRDIQMLVKRGENDFLEFKRKARFPEKIMKEVVAFANTKGGILMIGVDDNGTIPGLKFASEEAYVLKEAISSFCFPKIKYKSEIVQISDQRSVINYKIFESESKPHYVKINNRRKKQIAYIRVSDKSIQASWEMIEILRSGKSNKGVRFHFGEIEKSLFKYFQDNKHITISKFIQLAGISYSTASRILVKLVLANVLKIDARENNDLFSVNENV